MKAVAERDGQAACALLSPAGKVDLVSFGSPGAAPVDPTAAAGDCPQFVEGLVTVAVGGTTLTEDTEVGGVEIKGDTATVEFGGDTKIELRQVSGDWKVSCTFCMK